MITFQEKKFETKLRSLKFSIFSINFSYKRSTTVFQWFLLDAGVFVIVEDAAVVVIGLHMLMSDKGTQTGDEQHESTTHT